MFLITGCPRSGTGFISKVLSQLSLSVGHETYGDDGVVNCFFAVDTKLIQPWATDNLSVNDYNFDCVLHQVRNPLDCISSCYFCLHEKSWKFFSNFIDFSSENLLLKSMELWYNWNLLCEKKAIYTYRVENINFEIYKIMNLISKSENIKLNIDNVSTNTNSYGKHKKFTWEELYNCDKNLTDKIRNMAVKYGYKI